MQGFQAPGAAQEYFVVTEDRVLVFDDSISLEKGGHDRTRCCCSTCCKPVGSVAGKNVVVWGAGIIGNLVAQQAKLKGPRRVLVTDVSDHRIALAKECGIDVGVNVREKDFLLSVKDLFAAEGFEVGFKTAGVENFLNFLMEQVEKAPRSNHRCVHGKSRW